MIGINDIWDNLAALRTFDCNKSLGTIKLRLPNLTKAVITAQKGHIGHTFCAAGAIESIFAILSIRDGVIPNIRNLKEPLDGDLNFAKENVKKPVNVVLKNSLSFGGVNVALVFKAYNEESKL